MQVQQGPFGPPQGVPDLGQLRRGPQIAPQAPERAPEMGPYVNGMEAVSVNNDGTVTVTLAQQTLAGVALLPVTMPLGLAYELASQLLSVVPQALAHVRQAMERSLDGLERALAADGVGPQQAPSPEADLEAMREEARRRREAMDR